MIKKKRLTSLFNKYTIKKQLYLVYMAVVVAPVILIGMFLLLYTYHMMVNYHTGLLDSDNRRVRSILFEITTQIYNISENISFDNGIREVLTADFDDRQAYMEAVAGNEILDNYEKNYTELHAVEIYTDNPTFSEYKQFIPVNEETKKLPWYQKAIAQSGVFWKELSWEDQNGNRYWNLCLIRKIPLVGSPYHAVLVIRVSDNYLRTRVDNSDYISMVSVDKGPVLYSTDREKYGQAQPWMIDYEQPHFRYAGRTRLDGRRCFVNVSALNTYQSDSRIYICSIDKKGYNDIFSILNICCMLLLIALTIPGMMIRYFADNFTERVGVLRQEMHKASNQDYELISAFQGNDELSEAFEDLQIMVQNIKQHEAKAYEVQIKEQELLIRQQEMEFKMLSSQINPHFLYNTLETIRMKAFTAGDKEAATAIKLLGQSMRYVLENTGNHDTTLKEALDHVNVYMKIQHLRFGDRIRYETQIEEGLRTDEYRILPLLLQPVVENAIVHGLEEKEDGGRILLAVSLRQENNVEQLVIDVEDNGCGMTQEMLDRLRKDIEIRDMSRSKSIGLYNINQRMKLHYGNAYSLHIYSSPGQGTRVRVAIPVENTRR